MKPLPPLNSLKTFMLTSRYNSFSQAAIDNYMTKGAVSQQIKLLEDWMGVRLFMRTSAGIELTSAGIELKKTCDISFSLLENKIYELKKKISKLTKIKIGCSSSILRHLFLQNQNKINSELPEFQLSYDTTATIDSLLNNSIDIYLSREVYPPVIGLKEVTLFKDEIGMVSARNYLDRHVEGVTVCHAQSRGSAWNEWCTASGRMLPVIDELYFETLSLALDAARFGLGVVVAPWFVVEPEIRLGNLHSPFGFVECGRGTWLYHLESSSNDTMHFIDKLKYIANELKVAPLNKL